MAATWSLLLLSVVGAIQGGAAEVHRQRERGSPSGLVLLVPHLGNPRV